MLTVTSKCIFVVDIATHARLLWHGFHFYRSSIAHSVGIFPPRPQTFVASQCSPALSLTYWYRPHTSRTELPILFIHGIGVGLFPYIDLLKELNEGRRTSDGEIGGPRDRDFTYIFSYHFTSSPQRGRHERASIYSAAPQL